MAGLNVTEAIDLNNPERKMDDHFLELFRRLIQDRFGIYIQPEKDYLLRSKLSRLMSKTSYKNLATFYNLLKQEDAKSVEVLIRYITTNHTFFFREADHLEILRRDILARQLRYPVIWCAASSTGEEVYSVCIELLDHHIGNFILIASDLNRHVLHHLKQGIYTGERMKGISPERREKYFEPCGEVDDEVYTVKKIVREHVLVKQINIVKAVRFERTFDYIFCRNALIYFDKPTQRFVVTNLLQNLDSRGLLFVGHAEPLLNHSGEVTAVASSVYRKKQVK